jgi:hypothetical protein
MSAIGKRSSKGASVKKTKNTKQAHVSAVKSQKKEKASAPDTSTQSRAHPQGDHIDVEKGTIYGASEALLQYVQQKGAAASSKALFDGEEFVSLVFSLHRIPPKSWARTKPHRLFVSFLWSCLSACVVCSYIPVQLLGVYVCVFACVCALLAFSCTCVVCSFDCDYVPVICCVCTIVGDSFPPQRRVNVLVCSRLPRLRVDVLL